jgi:aquaporin Z
VSDATQKSDKVYWIMKKCLAEAFGTYILVLAGTGAIVVNDVSGGAITHVGIALTFGLVVMAMIYAIGDISGAHLNPAVTLGLFAARRFEGRWVVPYLASQVAGAVLASCTLHLLFEEHPTLGATIPVGQVWKSVVLEFLLTLILMLVILNVTLGSPEKTAWAGVAIGSVIGLEALFAGPICGASMNPARSLGPALVSMQLEHVWVYLLAPTLGALAGVGGCICIRDAGCCTACTPKYSN